MSEEHQISSAVGAPILFRTTSEKVRRAALEAGSLWLRSAQYYADSEDQVRNDATEGMSASRGTIPLRLGGVHFTRPGTLARQSGPHYILSLHGTCISKAQHTAFGGYSFGIKEPWRLAMAIHHEVEKANRLSGVQIWTCKLQARIPQPHAKSGRRAGPTSRQSSSWT